MAAWFDSDPWNLWPGWPSGYLGETVSWGRSAWPGMPWSNVANTLAYSDKYVWTWSSNTHYSATFDSLNPFLASIANQTFNTGREQVATFTEDFSSDPLKRGWYFNFSFMDIGRRPAPDDGPPQLVQTTDAVAYAWQQTDNAVVIRGNWTRGEFSEIEGLAAPQQRRYVRPVEPLTRSNDIRFEADFTVDAFGSDASNPILLGLFHSQVAVDRQVLALRIDPAGGAALIVTGDGTPWTLPIPVPSPLTIDRGYRASIDYVASSRSITVTLHDRTNGTVVATATAALPTTVGPFVFDEAGLGQRESAFDTPAASAYRFRLEGFSLGDRLHPLISQPSGVIGELAAEASSSFLTRATLEPAVVTQPLHATLEATAFAVENYTDEQGGTKRRRTTPTLQASSGS